MIPQIQPRQMHRVREEGKKEAIKTLQEKLNSMGEDNDGPVKDIYTAAVSEIAKL